MNRALYSSVAGFGIFLAFILAGALLWARCRDPFERFWFNVPVEGAETLKCVAVLPKAAVKPLPVVFFLRGDQNSIIIGAHSRLRQIAEMGLAAVGIEYDQVNQKVAADQFKAALNHVIHQNWADTHRIAWAGYSLGAQNLLSFALRYRSIQPDLLIQLGGGWVNELGPMSQCLNNSSCTLTSNSDRPVLKNASPPTKTLNPPSSPLLRCPVLFIHGQNDKVFPLAEAELMADLLHRTGTPVELRVITNQGHGFLPEGQVLGRFIGEYCVTHLKGADALRNNRSILSWQKQAKPLWLFLLPAFLWTVFWLFFRQQNHAFFRPSPSTDFLLGTQTLPNANPINAPSKACYTGRFLCCLAAVLMIPAFARFILLLVPPLLPINEFTLHLARKHILKPAEIEDFNFLAENRAWHKYRLNFLLENVQLAKYNRHLVEWSLDTPLYQHFVLSPEISLTALGDGDYNWRRTLWEDFYPRIRKLTSIEQAAQTVVRHLRERVTIASGDNLPNEVLDIWSRQITSKRGFESIYVAALRAIGIPARFDAQESTELWNGTSWLPAPRPIIQ